MFSDTMLVLSTIVLSLTALLFILAPLRRKFGRTPRHARLERIQRSANYRNGVFQNLNHTPDLAEDSSYYKAMRSFLFGESKRRKPSKPLPSKKIDLHYLELSKNLLIWFGHSSYYLQVDGKRFLIDPVFSGAASPLSFTTPSFAGSDVYTAQDIPPLDCLILTHDHWDHLDYETVVALQNTTKRVVTSLGVGEHLEMWGFDMNCVQECDWYEQVDLGEGFSLTATPARHFSGRGLLSRKKTLWSSFVLQSPNMKLFLGGDSGFDTHFYDIGQRFGPFHLAILECGQYNAHWKYIHMMPEQCAQAAIDLQAQVLMPVHWAKFNLAPHAWDDSIHRVSIAARKLGLPLFTPMIGEAVDITKKNHIFTEWWKTVD